MASRPRHRSGFLLVYALANAGGVIGWLPLLTLLLPIRVERIAGDARLGLFTATALAGAAAASGSNILFGWLSDRSVARGGGRRRWIAVGVSAIALAYAGVAAAATPVALVLAVIGVQIAVNGLLAPLLAIMADEVPEAQRGVAAGLLAFAAPVAAAMTAALVALSPDDETTRLALVPLAVAACVAPLLLTRARPISPEMSPEAPPRAGRDASRTLAVAWAARLLVQIAGVVLSCYLLYYFETVARGVAGLSGRVAHLLVLAYLVPLPAAVLMGRWSDRLGRRAPFLLGAAGVAAAGLIGMAAARDFTGGAVAFGLYATGSSVFLSLYAAWAIQLLPSARHRGRDLGVLNLSNTLPSVLGPGLAWLLATPRDFTLLLLVLAALTLGGGLATLAGPARD